MACRDIDKRRRNLERFHQRTAERRAAGLCLKCGKTGPAPERTLCEPCLDKRRAADRERSRRRSEARRAAGICVKCKIPTLGGAAYCAPCLVAKEERRDREAEYAAKRARYAERRRRAAASSATRRRRAWRAASPVRASTARARERFAASRSGTPPGR